MFHRSFELPGIRKGVVRCVVDSPCLIPHLRNFPKLPEKISYAYSIGISRNGACMLKPCRFRRKVIVAYQIMAAAKRTAIVASDFQSWPAAIGSFQSRIV